MESVRISQVQPYAIMMRTLHASGDERLSKRRLVEDQTSSQSGGGRGDADRLRPDAHEVTARIHAFLGQLIASVVRDRPPRSARPRRALSRVDSLDWPPHPQPAPPEGRAATPPRLQSNSPAKAAQPPPARSRSAPRQPRDAKRSASTAAMRPSLNPAPPRRSRSRSAPS